MKKKGALGWDMIGKLILMLIGILVLITIIGMLTGKSDVLWDKIKGIITFGG